MIDWSTHYARRAAGRAGPDVSELLALLSRPNVASFAAAIPGPTLFPHEALRAAYDFVLSHPKRAATALSVFRSRRRPRPQGLDRRRHEPLGRALPVENVFVTSGSQQALDLRPQALRFPRETILTGRPTFLGALQAFNAYEPRYEELPGQTATAAR